MRELRFDGLSQDGIRLLLTGNDGQKYSLVIDERVSAAVRRDRARISQVELQQAGALRPREIQARIRSGATAQDVAAASGLPLEHIRRFEGPVLTERAWVAHQAQATEVRRPEGDISLGSFVAERLEDQGVSTAAIGWDAWRRDDGLWVVIATFPFGPNTLIATWTYDAMNRTMTVADDTARQLSVITEGPLRLSLGAAEPPNSQAGHDADVIELARVDQDRARVDQAADPDVSAELEDLPAVSADDQDADADDVDERDATRELPAGLAALFEAPVPAKRNSRPAVPNFDDILFGPRPRT